jgi:ribosomal protein L37AE/L43A
LPNANPECGFSVSDLKSKAAAKQYLFENKSSQKQNLPMCQTRELKRSANGLVTHCKNCHHVQIAFGTVAFTLPESEFPEFLEQMAAYSPNYNRDILTKNIWIPLRQNLTCLVLNGKELEELKDLLNDSFQSLLLAELLHDLPIAPSDSSNLL